MTQLRLSKARDFYECSQCSRIIRQGEQYFRLDPHPMARMHRGEQVQYFCLSCVLGDEQAPIGMRGKVEELRYHWLQGWPEGSRRELRGFEFVDYLSRLMERNVEFRNVRTQAILDDSKRFQADIVAEEISGNRWERVVVECKVQSSYTEQRSQDVLAQLKSYGRLLSNAKLVFAFPGTLSQGASEAFQEASIEVWDLAYLSRRFGLEIQSVEHPILQDMLVAAESRAEKSREEELIEKLKLCDPGRENWLTYQDLVGTILETLLCPPLSTPISELPDAFGVNRRDFILPNYAEEGFWAFMRSRYIADCVVVDAKNYKGKVKKPQALQIANYLKEHGSGLFGMIVSRNSPDSGCMHTLRETWIVQRKLVIVLTDSDIEQMLLAQQSGNPPETIIKQKIEGFRLSL